MWTNNLASLRRDHDSAIVDSAFEYLKAEERPEGQNISIQGYDATSIDTDEGFFERFFSTEEEDIPFEEWLVDFEKKVHERTEYLRDRQ